MQANAIARDAEGKRVVIIGTSFIGMEVGAYLSDKAASVDCIDIAAVPFERVLGERIGRSLQTVRKLLFLFVFMSFSYLSIYLSIYLFTYLHVSNLQYLTCNVCGSCVILT